MAGNSDTSPLHYPMSWYALSHTERRTVYQENFCVRMITDSIWQEHLLPSSPIRDRVQERATLVAHSAIASHDHLFYV